METVTKEFTLMELLQKKESLERFVQMEIPAVVSFRFSAISDAISKNLEQFEREKMRLFAKHGDEIEDGSKLQVSGENLEEFNKELQELLQETAEIEFRPVPIHLLDSISLTIADMSFIKDFFVESAEAVS